MGSFSIWHWVIVLLIIGVPAWLIIRSARASKKQPSGTGPVGVGGWLLFLGISLGLGLLATLGQLTKEGEGFSDAWANPVARPFLVAFGVGAATQVGLHAVTLFALYNHKRYFQDVFVWFWLASVLITPVVMLIGVETTGLSLSQVWPTDQIGRHIGGAIGLSLWLWYVLVSVRVRNTMTR